MVKFNFTLQHVCKYVLTCCFLSTIVLNPSQLQAQANCSLACTGTIQVSLDMYCEAEITPDMVLNDDATSCPDGVYEVIIQDQYGNDMSFPYSSDGYPVVDGSLIGYTAYVKVVDVISGNSCWGNLICEDKLPPMIDCTDTERDLYCYDLIDFKPSLVSGFSVSHNNGLSNAVMINDGATEMNNMDAVRRLGVNKVDCNELEVSFEWQPRPANDNSALYGVNIKLFYAEQDLAAGTTWSEVMSWDFEGTAGNNNIAPYFGQWNPVTITHVVPIGSSGIGQDFYRVSIMEKNALDDEIAGDYACTSCGSNGGTGRDFDNADKQFNIIEDNTCVSDELCNDVHFDMIAEDIDVNECNGLYDDEILKVVTRTYVAVDKWGNKSQPCTYTFNVLRPNEDAIHGPKNYFNNNGDAFDCGYFEYDHYGNPIIDPLLTGVPFIGCVDGNFTDESSFSGSEVYIDFDDYTGLITGNEYAAQGLTISNSLGGNLYTGSALNLISDPNGLHTEFGTMGDDQITMSFSSIMNRAGFYLIDANPGDLSVEVTCFLDGLVVDQQTIDPMSVYYYGIESGNGFDQISIEVVSSSPSFVIDDLRFESCELENIPLYPEPEVYCNILSTYSDLTLEVDCVVKVVRTWTIIEWNCDPRTFDPIVQMIEIKDNKAPEIDAHHDLTLSTNIAMDYYHPQHGQIYCGANINLPEAYVHDECYDDVHVTVNIQDLYENPVDFIDGNGGYAQVPQGHYIAIYEAKDGCYNSAKDTIHLWVQDLTPPVPVCDNNTVVSLNNHDGTHVYVSTFDEGSYDDCQLSRVVGRRMNANVDTCDCPVGLYGFHYLGRYNDKDYYISKHEYTADKAKSEAAALEGHVFSYNTADERDWVYDAVFHHSYQEECFWIGLKNDYGNDYVWHDGTDFPAGASSPMWANGGPTPGYGHCTFACYDGGDYTGTWYNAPCHDDLNDYLHKYVLEMPVCGFSDAVSFCCNDFGDNMVVLRAIDASCNYNDCMVNVEVQDKTAPSIICPPDESVYCTESYDIHNMGATFGYAYTAGTCGDTLVETVEEFLDQCQQGHIIRTFTATSSGGASASCYQTIYFTNNEEFVIDCSKPDNPNDDVEWPIDTTIYSGCDDPNSQAYHPDELGYPHFLGNSQCHLVGVNWEDEIFEFNGYNGSTQSCFKILRRWSVIDWCNYNPNTGQHYSCTYEQVIKLNNTDKPFFTDGNGNPIECLEDKEPVCTYDYECEEGFVELVATAYDSCSHENLTWQYEIFLNYKEHYGSFDYDYKETGYGNIANASADEFGNPINYEIGTHLIRWTFFDRCGNAISCDQEFTIVNCIKPTAYCLSGLAVDLGIHIENGDTTGYVELWASDFDAGSYHHCGYYVTAHFDPDDLLDTGMVFNCEDVGYDTVMVYFTAVDYHGDPIINEVGDYLQSFCTAVVHVQDNQGACGDIGMKVGIAGAIMDENDSEIGNVMVDLIGAAGILEMTDEFGEYAFPEMPVGNGYDIDPYKDDDHLNGVSTLDIVMIQRHVLGVNAIDSPYKIIAADINNDKTVSAIDVIELRKMILGIYSEFPVNDSWRFIDKEYTFYDENPLDEAFPEIYQISSLQDEMVIDFVGVKIGDVNNSATLNFTGPSVDTRSFSTLDLTYDLVKDQATTTVDVYADQLTELYGMQFTLQLDGAVTDVLPGTLNIDEQNIALIGEDLMTFSWNSTQLVKLDLDQPLFSIIVEGLSSDIIMNSAVTKQEAYASDLTAMDLQLTPRDGNTYQFELAQNVPNPFSNYTTIDFTIPTDMEVEFIVYDVAGKVVMQENGFYPAGKHSLNVNSDGISGINYYTIKAGKFTATKKMVVIK